MHSSDVAQPALGKTIAALRERAGDDMTSSQLADRARLDLRVVEGIEAGGDAPWDTIALLARALGVTMEELADLHEEILSKEGLSIELSSSEES